jgi:hypothetical protein
MYVEFVSCLSLAVIVFLMWRACGAEVFCSHSELVGWLESVWMETNAISERQPIVLRMRYTDQAHRDWERETSESETRERETRERLQFFQPAHSTPCRLAVVELSLKLSFLRNCYCSCWTES